MPTSALVAIAEYGGNYSVIRVLMDGYPQHTGYMLYTHYSTYSLARRLVSYGDLRVVDKFFPNWGHLSSGHCQLDEPGVAEGTAFCSSLAVLWLLAQERKCDVLYVFVNDTWECSVSRGPFLPVATYLKEKA